MTDYELVYLFKEVTRLASDFFLGYISIVVGFLAIGLFFGQMLSRILIILTVGLYSFLSIAAISSIWREYQTFEAMALQIRKRAAEGADLAWLPVVQAPEIAFRVAPISIGLMLVVIFCASIYFFFQVRGIDPKDFR